MDDAAATLAEEVFSFPQYAAMLDRGANKGFALGRVRQLHDTKIVPVRVGPGHLDQTVVYEYTVDAKPHAAVLVRSAWLRPIGSMDGARPLKIQVLIDDEVALEQPIDEHLRNGYPFPIRACSCNRWQKTLECKCSVTPLLVGPLSKLYPAVGLDEEIQALPDNPYGVFAPNKTIVQVRVVKPGHGAVEFQARCGITAALYSTSTKEFSA